MRDHAQFVGRLLFVLMLGFLTPQNAEGQTGTQRSDEIQARIDTITTKISAKIGSTNYRDLLEIKQLRALQQNLIDQLGITIRAEHDQAQRGSGAIVSRRSEPQPPGSISPDDQGRRQQAETSIQRCIDGIKLPDNCSGSMTTDCINARIKETRRCEAKQP